MSKRTKGHRKTIAKLLRKRQVISDWLQSKGVDVSSMTTEMEFLQAAYRQCGQEPKFKHVTMVGAHARYAFVMGLAGLGPVPVGQVRVDKPPPRQPADAKRFYESYEWRKLRYQILARDGAKCALCGADRHRGVVLHVDHIKPLRKFWELRLDPENLQVLCEVCNHGKGNWDETNWREKAA